MSTSRAMPSSNGVYFCDSIRALRLPWKSTSISNKSGLDARDVERQHADRVEVERGAGRHDGVPDLQRCLPRHPDLVAKVAGVAGARDIYRHAGNGPAGGAEVAQANPDVGGTDAAQERGRRRSLQRQRRHLFRHVLDLDVEARRVLRQPAQARVRRRPAIRLLPHSRHRPVVDDLAIVVAPGRVVDLPDGHLRGVARDDAVDQASRVLPRHAILEQRGDVDQAAGVAQGVVFVLVVRLVGADRVVAGPVAIVEAFAQFDACGRGRRNRRARREVSTSGFGAGAVEAIRGQ